MEHLTYQELDQLGHLLRRFSLDIDASKLHRITALELERPIGNLANTRRVVAIIDDNHRCATTTGDGPGDAHLIRGQ